METAYHIVTFSITRILLINKHTKVKMGLMRHPVTKFYCEIAEEDGYLVLKISLSNSEEANRILVIKKS